MKADELIRIYGMEPHPEGGFYRETYRSAGSSEAPYGRRSFSTAVCFLLRRGEVSLLHRLKADEVWHFYDGGPLTVAEIAPDGRTRTTVMGRDHAAGQACQHVVPAGSWFGAFPSEGADLSFVGCTVAPGFEFADFELADRAAMLRDFPAAGDLIIRLTKGK